MKLKRIHPRTGEELKPLFVTKNGRTVWPQLGASPDDSSNDDEGDGTGDDDGDDDGTSGAGDDDGGDSDDGKEAVTRKDLEAVVRRMKAADQRASKAEAELKKIEDAKKDDLTKATERAEQAEAKVAAMEAKLLEADLRDAFGQVKGFSWRRPATALRIARADGYLDDLISDGGIDQKALAKKVKEFSEAYPELLSSEDSGPEDGSAGSKRPTGQPAGSGRKRPAAPDDADIKKRYGHLLR